MPFREGYSVPVVPSLARIGQREPLCFKKVSGLFKTSVPRCSAVATITTAERRGTLDSNPNTYA
jgi:hypothetical protein